MKHFCKTDHEMKLTSDFFFWQKSPIIIVSFAKRDLQTKASYASSPPWNVDDASHLFPVVRSSIWLRQTTMELTFTQKKKRPGCLVQRRRRRCFPSSSWVLSHRRARRFRFTSPTSFQLWTPHSLKVPCFGANFPVLAPIFLYFAYISLALYPLALGLVAFLDYGLGWQ